MLGSETLQLVPSSLAVRRLAAQSVVRLSARSARRKRRPCLGTVAGAVRRVQPLPLLLPRRRHPLRQPLQQQPARLPALDDGVDDVRRQYLAKRTLTLT